MSLEHASLYHISPQAAYSLCDIALLQNAQVIIQTGACGTIGKLIDSYLRNKGIIVINIVTNKDQA